MSIADDDRSLLFATLAARSGLISISELDEALKRWAADRSRFIAEVLDDLGSLDAQKKAAVEQLMRLHLSQHGNDPSQSLRALSTVSVQDASAPDQDNACSYLIELTGFPGDPDVTLIPGNAGRSRSVGAAGAVGDARFQVIRLHAKGGLGEVHVAYDRELDRDVALKEIQAQYADDLASRTRFLLEARITGNLEHPGIVPVYALGQHEDGRPYYTMRFVRGESLRDAIDRFHRSEGRPRTRRDRALRLRKFIVRFLAVCDAVDYAHSRGVIHRDLKPSNILLGPHGETLVVDWGLARPLDELDAAEADAEGMIQNFEPESKGIEATVAIGPQPSVLLGAGSGSTEQTVPGVAVGTPHYMAPEQAIGDSERIGPASDVYSLGATLSTLLTGHPPIEGSDPKSILNRVKTGEVVAARSRDRTIDPCLDAICSKAMAFEPADRYPTARALADDLERWLADEPVSARRDPFVIRLGRWSRRHQTWVAGVLAALLVALGSLGFIGQVVLDRQQARLDREVALAEAREADREAQVARDAERLQRYYALFDRLRQRSADPRPGWTWQARDELAEAARLRPREDVDGAALLRTIAAERLATFDYKDAEDLLLGLNPSCVAFAPNGQTLALGEFKAQGFLVCSVVLVDWPSGTIQRRLSFPASFKDQIRDGGQDGVRRMTFDAEGRWLAAGTRSGRIQLWDLQQDDPHRLVWSAHEGNLLGLAFAAGGDAPAIVSCGEDGALRRWELDAPRRAPRAPAAEFRGEGPVQTLAISRSGALACVVGGRLHRHDPNTLESIEQGPEVGSNRLAWSPDGRMIAAGGSEAITLVSSDRMQVVDLLTDPELSTAAHRYDLSDLDFHPSGSLLASACSHDDDRCIKFWDASTGQMVGSIHEAEGTGYGLIDVAFDPDGDQIVTTGKGRATQRELTDHPAYEAIGLDETLVKAVAYMPDGQSVARLGRSEDLIRVELWSFDGPKRLAGLDLPAEGSDNGGPLSLAVSPKGDYVAFSGTGAGVLLWKIGSEAPPEVIGRINPSALQFSTDGRRLWFLFDDQREIGCWDLERQAQIVGWRDRGAEIVRGMLTLPSLTLAEPWIAAGGRDGLTRLLRLDADDPVLVRQWDHKDGPIHALALREDGSLVVSGTSGGALVLIPLPDGVPSATIGDAHPGGVSSLAIAPDGRTLASGGVDQVVRLWRIDASTLRLVATLGEATGPIIGLDFAPDGRSLAVAVEGEQAMRLWRLDRLESSWDAGGIGIER
ncbi:protein kinase domain-containing protein [Tautonia rosea]|uniref:protein kinase domain-containing protein n=1 Tax=Tautonia rosea TaxID=2728037 RepID=UPI0014750AD7|nr:protein kinase [Tautonia rosea]